jgi:hypothetical protein
MLGGGGLVRAGWGAVSMMVRKDSSGTMWGRCDKSLRMTSVRIRREVARLEGSRIVC